MLAPTIRPSRTVIRGLRFPVSALVFRAQPKRITEIDRVAVGKPVEVEAAGEPDGIFLGKPPGFRIVDPGPGSRPVEGRLPRLTGSLN
jgi:hypothetical protein